MVSYMGIILYVPFNHYLVDVVYDMAGYHSRKAIDGDEDEEDEINELSSDMEKKARLPSQRKHNGNGMGYAGSFTKSIADVRVL
jgi:hypothetical protein